MGHQNPSRQTLINMAPSIRDGGVSRLHHEDLDEFEQQAVQRLARTHRLAQFIGGDPLPFTGDLDVGGMRRLIAAEHYGDPAHALAANEADFYTRLVGLDGDD